MLNYFILGTIQGIFEWIPVSSQGVVALISRFLIKEIHPLEVALFLHLGTLLAALFYFRKEWLRVFRFENIILLRFLAISTAISGIVAFSLYNLVKDMTMGGGLLVVTGFGLLFTAYFHRARRAFRIGFDKLAVIAGILQGLAVIPGLSRSGATIFGLSFGKFKPEEILKISYMMSAPAVLGLAGFLFFRNPVLFSEAWPALIFSFFAGLLTLSFLFKLGAQVNFFKFALIFAFLCFLGAGLELLI